MNKVEITFKICKEYKGILKVAWPTTAAVHAELQLQQFCAAGRGVNLFLPSLQYVSQGLSGNPEPPCQSFNSKIVSVLDERILLRLQVLSSVSYCSKVLLQDDVSVRWCKGVVIPFAVAMVEVPSQFWTVIIWKTGYITLAPIPDPNYDNS